MSSIYIHIPFCKQACHYCDFHFSTGRHDMKEMTSALEKEIVLQKNYLLGDPVETIYFGGGTPSFVDPGDIDNLLATIHDHFETIPQAEITLEANPDDISPASLDEWLKSGINRLSLGIQTYEDQLLKYLNRAHNSATALGCMELIRQSGFENLSLDLIYGIPGLSMDGWSEALMTATAFRPSHWSAYALTIEDRTVFGSWRKQGKLVIVDEETVARQFELLMDTLEKAGYEHYEISNFALPGMYSKHNSGYWKQTRYLGIGPSAHSYDLDSRQFNIRNNAMYIKSLREGQIPFEKEILSRENKINEYILTTLRTKWGCDLEVLKKNYDYDLLAFQGDIISLWKSKGLITQTGNQLLLTRKGKLLADKLTGDLMVGS